MKKCPNCSLIFEDDNVFCAADGSPLMPFHGGRVVIPWDDNISREMPTEVVSLPTVPPPAAASGAAGDSSKILYGIIGGLVALVLALGATFFFLLQAQRETAGSRNGKSSSENSTLDPLSAARDSTTTDAASPAAAQSSAPSSQTAITTPTPPVAPRLNISPRGRWSGDWSSSSGAYLTLVVDLNEDGGGGNRVSGQIEWTMQRTTRPEKMSKIGMKAIEYVSGQYDPATRSVVLKGYRKDDPYGVLVMLDDYRLNLSEDNRRLNGAARNGGKWNGRVNLSR